MTAGQPTRPVRKAGWCAASTIEEGSAIENEFLTFSLLVIARPAGCPSCLPPGGMDIE